MPGENVLVVKFEDSGSSGYTSEGMAPRGQFSAARLKGEEEYRRYRDSRAVPKWARQMLGLGSGAGGSSGRGGSGMSNMSLLFGRWGKVMTTAFNGALKSSGIIATLIMIYEILQAGLGPLAKVFGTLLKLLGMLLLPFTIALTKLLIPVLKTLAQVVSAVISGTSGQDPLQTVISGLVGGIVGAIVGNLPGALIGLAAGSLAPSLGSMFDKLIGPVVDKLLSTITSFLGGLGGGAFKGISDFLKNLDLNGITSFLDQLKSDPLSKLLSMVSGIDFETVRDHMNSLRDMLGKMVTSGIAASIQVARVTIDALVSEANKWLTAITTVRTSIDGTMRPAIDNVAKALNGIAGFLAGYDWSGALVGLFGGNFTTGASMFALQNLSNISNSIGNLLAGRATASGGIVTSPQWRMVGEAGPEAIIPLNKAGGMGTTVVVNGNIYGDQDFIDKVTRAVDRAMWEKMRTVYGGAYGMR